MDKKVVKSTMLSTKLWGHWLLERYLEWKQYQESLSYKLDEYERRKKQ